MRFESIDPPESPVASLVGELVLSTLSSASSYDACARRAARRLRHGTIRALSGSSSNAGLSLRSPSPPPALPSKRARPHRGRSLIRPATPPEPDPASDPDTDAAFGLDIEAVVATEPVEPDDAAGRERIGSSREGRPIFAYRFGRGHEARGKEEGPRHISLVGGCHADEPVGPWTLRRLARHLAALPDGSPSIASTTWSIVPHANPDGEERNRAWSGDGRDLDPAEGFDFDTYMRHRVRERPGDDIEFGFPRDDDDTGARPENRAVAAWLRARAAEAGPIRVHGSLHGMGIAAGPWFLIDRAWVGRSAELRERLARDVRALGHVLHDVDRKGEKGFDRIAPGFCTRPDSESMRRFFLDRDDGETADRFRPSSMELARGLGDDVFSFVSEMPLFLGDRQTHAGASASSAAPPRPMPIGDQTRLQLRFLEEAVRATEAPGSSSR